VRFVQAVILAGGLATRMRPKTLTIPKAMLEVAGRPFIDWQLEKLVACGFDNAVLCVAFLADQIRDHVGDGSRFGIRVRYVDEGPTLLGTAGALRCALELLNPTFLVTYGDSYLPFDYAEPLRRLDAYVGGQSIDGVMSVYRNAGQWDASNVRTDGTWVLAYEKGTRDPSFDCIDYGALALRRDVVAALPEKVSSDLAVLQRDLAAARRLLATMASVRFFEIGSPDGLLELDRHLQSNGRAGF
jgi:N-acetyl-alpha-D-muramate 1-phosphate uridylyltransferase